MSESKKEIIVVGAGLVGSLLSIYLTRRGYKVSIYERRGDMRTIEMQAGRSINLALSDRGIKALKEVGIMDEIKKIAIPMNGRLMHDKEGNEVYQAYEAGDALSIEMLDQAWDYLGIAIANLIVTFDPDVIAIGGGVSRIGKVMFDKVKASAKKRCIEFMFNSVKIVPTGLKQDTGVIGAIALALVNSRAK